MKEIAYFPAPNQYFYDRRTGIHEEKRCTECDGFGFVLVVEPNWALCLDCYGTGQRID